MQRRLKSNLLYILGVASIMGCSLVEVGCDKKEKPAEQQATGFWDKVDGKTPVQESTDKRAVDIVTYPGPVFERNLKFDLFGTRCRGGSYISATFSEERADIAEIEINCDISADRSSFRLNPKNSHEYIITSTPIRNWEITQELTQNQLEEMTPANRTLEQITSSRELDFFRKIIQEDPKYSSDKANTSARWADNKIYAYKYFDLSELTPEQLEKRNNLARSLIRAEIKFSYGKKKFPLPELWVAAISDIEFQAENERRRVISCYQDRIGTPIIPEIMGIWRNAGENIQFKIYQRKVWAEGLGRNEENIDSESMSRNLAFQGNTIYLNGMNSAEKLVYTVKKTGTEIKYFHDKRIEILKQVEAEQVNPLK